MVAMLEFTGTGILVTVTATFPIEMRMSLVMSNAKLTLTQELFWIQLNLFGFLLVK